MELLKRISPCDAGEALALWEAVFGAAEVALEAPQLDGSEVGENLDMLFELHDAGKLIGTVHATIPRERDAMCGLSGMCVAPEYRGRGLARQLFGGMLEELEGMGVEAFWLGTDNPAAACLYAKFGFSFLPGSNVMARFPRGDVAAFDRGTFGRAILPFRPEEGAPGARVPLIPLALRRGNQFLLDANAGLFSSAWVTQRSCMGLYPKYEAIRAVGGAFFCAWDAAGTLGAVASAVPGARGACADFFCCESFYPSIPELLRLCEARFGEISLRLSLDDAGKRACAEGLGYRPAGEETIAAGRLRVPCVVYRR